MKTIKYIVAAMAIFSVSCNAYAQNLIMDWQYQTTGSDWIFAGDIVIDDHSDIYIAGNSAGNTISDPGKSGGKEDIFLARISDDGKVLWSTTISTGHYCHISSLSTSPDGTFLCSGYFQERLNLFDQQLQSDKKVSAFIAKFDTAGSIHWIKTINGDFRGSKLHIMPFGFNRAVVAGGFTGKITLNDESFNSMPGTTNIFVALVDPEGEIERSSAISGKGDKTIGDLFIDEDGRIYLAGGFTRQLQYQEIELSSKGRLDGYLIGLDISLNPIIFKQVGSRYDECIKSVAVDRSDIILAGSYSDEIETDGLSLPEPEGKTDGFIMKLNHTGKIMWSDTFGGNAKEFVHDLRINYSGDIYVSGSCNSDIGHSAKFINISDNKTGIFVVKYTKSGELQYIEKLDDRKIAFCQDFELDQQGNIFIAGNTVAFSESVTNPVEKQRTANFHLSKMHDCNPVTDVILSGDTCLCANTFTIRAKEGFDQYLWDDGSAFDFITIQNTGLYSVIVSTTNGCVYTDSVHVVLNRLPDIGFEDTLFVTKGIPITLYGPAGMEEYLWSDGSTLSWLDISYKKLTNGCYQYSLRVKDYNGCSNTDTVVIATTGKRIKYGTEYVTGNSKTLSVEISPNPARDWLNLNIENIDTRFDLSLMVVTATGELVWKETFRSPAAFLKKTIDLKSIQPGTYILITRNDQTTIENRFVIM